MDGGQEVKLRRRHVENGIDWGVVLFWVAFFVVMWILGGGHFDTPATGPR
jgi:hypothetical protein